MRRSETIVSYTAEEIDEMIARGEDRTYRARIDAMTEEELEASIRTRKAFSRALSGIPAFPASSARLRC